MEKSPGLPGSVTLACFSISSLMLYSFMVSQIELSMSAAPGNNISWDRQSDTAPTAD